MQYTVVFAVTQSRLQQKFLFVTLLQGGFRQCIGAVCTISQLEFLDDVVAETTAAQIGHTNTLAVDVVMENILKIIGCKLIDNKQTFAQALCLFFFVG